MYRTPTLFCFVMLAMGGCRFFQRGMIEIPRDTSEPATAATGTPEDTGPPTVSVTYMAYEYDRDCWGIRTVERPAAYWSEWEVQNCGDDNESEQVYWIHEGEGHCGLFDQSLSEGLCTVHDPTGWFGYCDPTEHACCAAAQRPDTGMGVGVPGCMPDPYYQP